MRTTFVSLFILLIAISCTTKNPVPTDAQMIEHFNANKESLEELVSLIMEDNLNYYPLFIQDKENGVQLNISKERELEYIRLMDKLSIKRFRRPFKFEKINSIVFYYYEKGDATWSIDKGYEYMLTPNNSFTYEEGELWEVARRYNHADLRKKLNDRWNLVIMYDR